MKRTIFIASFILAVSGAVILSKNAKAQTIDDLTNPVGINCDATVTVVCAQVGSIIYYGKYKP